MYYALAKTPRFLRFESADMLELPAEHSWDTLSKHVVNLIV